jgi:hypothetical protein
MTNLWRAAYLWRRILTRTEANPCWDGTRHNRPSTSWESAYDRTHCEKRKHLILEKYKQSPRAQIKGQRLCFFDSTDVAPIPALSFNHYPRLLAINTSSTAITVSFYCTLRSWTNDECKYNHYTCSGAAYKSMRVSDSKKTSAWDFSHSFCKFLSRR